jgi:hypothetical protein
MKKVVLFILPFAFNFFASAQTTPTWSDDIACLLFTHCTGCHNDNGIAPFSLMSYNDAASAASGILFAVNNGNMPPWPPDRDYNRLAHERYLTPEEITLINDWVNAGAPEGDPVNAPSAPVYSGNAVITNPDLVVQIPDYTVGSSGDVYRCFVIPTSESTDKFITGFEVIPGNRSIVHHVLVFRDETGTPATLDANDPGPGYTSFGGIGSTAAKLIGGWVPGQGVFETPDGMGIKLPAGTNLVLQIHYPAGVAGEEDSTKIHIKFSPSSTLREISLAPPLNHQTSIVDGPLYIPANQVRTFHEEYTIPVNLTVLSVGPHMHLIGKSIKAYGVTPTNDTLKFIDIPNWDFHWQGSYMFRNPVKIPAGTVLYGEATYDNTIGNPNNPNNPPQAVSVGEATTDEMMLVYFSYLFYQNGDENIVIDDSQEIERYNNCNYNSLTSLEETEDHYYFSVYPNPASNSITVTSKNIFENNTNIIINDALGRQVEILRIPASTGANSANINIGNLSSGIYSLVLQSENSSVTKKFVVQK